MTESKINGVAEAWDNGLLGRDEEFAVQAPEAVTQQIDDSLGLQMISIRLSRELIQDFKMIAEVHGMGYQPLMREALKRFAEAELKCMAVQFANEKAAARARVKRETGIVESGNTIESVAGPKKRRERKAA